MLLVDDNPGDAGLVRAAVEEFSTPENQFSLVHAMSLGQAVKYVKDGSFDLILLDLSLPDAQGLDTVARMRDAAPLLPLVVMTGTDDQILAIEAMRKGAQDYLVKGQVDAAMLGRTIRYAIERKKSEAEINRELERQQVYNEINRAITSTLDLQSVMNILLEKVGELFPHYSSMAHLLNPQQDVLEAIAFRNVEESSWKQTVPGENKGFNSITASGRTPLVIRDVQNDPRSRRPEFLRRNGFLSYLGLPLVVNDEAVGVMALFAKENDAFADADIQFLSAVAGTAAIAISNSQLYEKLKHANETLEQTLEVKSMLTGVMAHELKTPIHVIMGTASLLADGMCGELNKEQREGVGKIEASADEMLRLIESSLDMARLEQGKMPLIVTEVRVRELLAELESDFSEACAKKGLGLEVNKPLSGFTIKTDHIKLKEILRNIIDNARKYTMHGKVSVEFAVKDVERVEFVVSDTGIGIKAELLPKIFELFYQVDPALKEHASAGFGLNIVKRLVGAMSGEIDVASEVGRGSTFRVILPREISAHLP